MDYKSVIVGGTFDLFHKGHKQLILKAFSTGETIYFGVNSDEFCKKHGKNIIQNQEERFSTVTTYLKEKNFLTRAKIHIHEETGCPAESNPTIEAIIVSDATIEGAHRVNIKRQENSLKPLEIISIPKLAADDEGDLSTTRIRNGEINREGNSYKLLFERDLIMPASLREELRKPFGVFAERADFKRRSKSFTVSIGDVVTARLIDEGIKINVALFDLKTKRVPVEVEIEKKLPKAAISVKNTPGTIEKDAVLKLIASIRETFSENTQAAIKIEGEEDLLTLPSILLSPLNANVYYGLPDKGAVLVVVTEEVKEKVTGLLRAFEKN